MLPCDKDDFVREWAPFARGPVAQLGAMLG